MGKFHVETYDQQIHGYFQLTHKGYFQITLNINEAAILNRFEYFGREYYVVGRGEWVGYYLSSQSNLGLCVYKKWSDAAYFKLTGDQLICCSFKSANCCASFSVTNRHVYCYEKQPGLFLPLKVTWDSAD